MPTSPLSTQLHLSLPSPEHEIKLREAQQRDIKVWVKRDDTIHPVISGNKWRKIKHHLVHAQQHQIQHIISFGGGFSNHLHALSYCCQQLNIRFTAIVRGNYEKKPSPMLLDLASWNTDIRYVNKITYQKRDTLLLKHLQIEFPDALIIPEGGSSELAFQGVADIINELTQAYDFILAPVASGGTLAGLIKASDKLSLSTQILGIGVLKGQDYLEELVNELLPDEHTNRNWKINHDYHFGGYAKKNAELISYCTAFNEQHAIQIEPIYSGKLFYALEDLLKRHYFPAGSRIIAIHTGGLQGAR